MTNRTLTALPVFNEAAHVADVLNEVRQHAADILVVDDGSSDATPALLARIPGVQTITHEQNRGYGAALTSAFGYALQHGYDALVTIDCDGQHQPRLIPVLAERIYEDDSIDLVSGSRYLQPADGQSLPPEDRRAINMQITRWLNQHLGLRLTDAFCGFKAYRVPSLQQLRITEPGYAMPLELWVQAVAAGWRIVEHPVPLVYLEEERSFGGALDDSRKRLEYYQRVLDSAVAAVERKGSVGCGGTR